MPCNSQCLLVNGSLRHGLMDEEMGPKCLKNVTDFWFWFLISYLGHHGMLVYALLSVSHVLIHRNTKCLQCLNDILRCCTMHKLFFNNKWIVSRARNTALFRSLLILGACKSRGLWRDIREASLWATTS